MQMKQPGSPHAGQHARQIRNRRQCHHACQRCQYKTECRDGGTMCFTGATGSSTAAPCCVLHESSTEGERVAHFAWCVHWQDVGIYHPSASRHCAGHAGKARQVKQAGRALCMRSSSWDVHTRQVRARQHEYVAAHRAYAGGGVVEGRAEREWRCRWVVEPPPLGPEGRANWAECCRFISSCGQ